MPTSELNESNPTQSPQQQLNQVRQRRRVVLVSVGAVLGLLVVVIGAIAWLYEGTPPTPDPSHEVAVPWQE